MGDNAAFLSIVCKKLLVMNRVIHFEIPATSPEISQRFYETVFDWKFNQFGPAPYFLATTGSDSLPGINGAIIKRNHPQQPVTTIISVENMDETIAKIQSAGGKIVVNKTAFPGVGWSAYFSDTDNNILGIWKEDKTAS